MILFPLFSLFPQYRISKSNSHFLHREFKMREQREQREQDLEMLAPIHLTRISQARHWAK